MSHVLMKFDMEMARTVSLTPWEGRVPVASALQMKWERQAATTNQEPRVVPRDDKTPLFFHCNSGRDLLRLTQ